jgi:hypothetical protein
MRGLVALAVSVTVMLGVSPALAQPGRTPPGPPPPASYTPVAPTSPMAMRRTKRYGAKIAAVDGLSAALVVVGTVVLVSAILSEDGGGQALGGFALMVGGSLGLVFGSPIVHWREGNETGALKSLALRVGIPLVGGLLGNAWDDRCQRDGGDDCHDNPWSALTGLAFLGAVAVDWFLLAKVEVDVTPYAAPAPYGGATIGVAGRL